MGQTSNNVVSERNLNTALPEVPEGVTTKPMADRFESLDGADLWMRDGLRVCPAPGGWGSLDVDMTRSLDIVKSAGQVNVSLSCNQIIFRATALVLSRHPELHKMASGSRVMQPGNVDLGISVAGDSFVAPVMVLRGAESKPLTAIAKESMSLIRKAKIEDRKLRALLRRWGWLVPFGWLRRSILSVAFSRASFRRHGVGTFQISCVAGLDSICPMMFNTAAILGVGGLRERPVVVDECVQIRPVVTLTCCLNHELWDGRAAVTFLSELRNILESGELAAEIPSVRAASAG